MADVCDDGGEDQKGKREGVEEFKPSRKLWRTLQVCLFTNPRGLRTCPLSSLAPSDFCLVMKRTGNVFFLNGGRGQIVLVDMGDRYN